MCHDHKGATGVNDDNRCPVLVGCARARARPRDNGLTGPMLGIRDPRGRAGVYRSSRRARARNFDTLQSNSAEGNRKKTNVGRPVLNDGAISGRIDYYRFIFYSFLLRYFFLFKCDLLSSDGPRRPLAQKSIRGRQSADNNRGGMLCLTRLCNSHR